MSDVDDDNVEAFKIQGANWDTWQVSAPSWPAVAKLLAALHAAGPVFVTVSIKGGQERVQVVGDGRIVWIVTLEPGTTLSVLGAEIPIEYTTEHLTHVQIEYPPVPVEDPAPATYWLPTQLGVTIEEALELLSEALLNPASIERTQVEMFPVVAAQHQA